MLLYLKESNNTLKTVDVLRLNTDIADALLSLLRRNLQLRSFQSSGWRVTKDFSTSRSRLCRLCTHRWAVATHTNTTTQSLSFFAIKFFLSLSAQHTSRLNNLSVHTTQQNTTSVHSAAVRQPPSGITGALSRYICFSFSSIVPLLLFILCFHCKYNTATNHPSSVPGQPPGALLHPLPRPGGRSYIPTARQGGEDSREQAGAWAEAQHYLPVLL